MRKGQLIAASQWQLNSDAKLGRYSSRTLIPRGREISTLITLQDGQIKVRSDLWPETVAEPQVPSNYVPEGLMSLVLFQAADQQVEIACRTIFDSNPIRHGDIQFHTLIAKPGRRRELIVKSAATPRGQLYRFNESGVVERLEDLDEGVSYDLTTAEEIIKHFEEAKQLLSPDPADQADSPDGS